MAYDFDARLFVHVERKGRVAKRKSDNEIALENEQFLSFLLNQKAGSDSFSLVDVLNFDVSAINIQNEMDGGGKALSDFDDLMKERDEFSDKEESLVEDFSVEKIFLNPAERETILDKRKKKK